MNDRKLFSVLYETPRKSPIWGITAGLQIWAIDKSEVKRIMYQKHRDCIIIAIDEVKTTEE